MNHLVTITKSDGTKELFEESKLVNSLKRVGASIETIEEVVEAVEKEMHEGMTTAQIYASAFAHLRKHAVRPATKYSVRRALAELGPDGFPFEKFIAKIFNAWGYEAITDQQVKGACIEHEVDVVAWKGGSLSMVEAKFHNEFGLKSDVKVALYVKARFDDIQAIEHMYGGKKRKLTDRWLFTNTKFTEQAITYGKYYGLNLVGWNYPEKENLHALIEEFKLQPVTCITSLSTNQKRDLVGRGIILCSDLLKDSGPLKNIGLNEMMVKQVVSEAEIIVSNKNQE